MATAAPAVMKAAPTNLADQLARQMHGIQERSYFALGHMMRLQLGVDDNSAYFQQQVNKRLDSITKVQGLTLDWNQDVYPVIGELKAPGGNRSEIFVFPNGIEAPPKIADPRIRRMSPTDPPVPLISQNIEDYASGQIFGRDGTRLVVLQPIEQIAVRTCGTLLLLYGRTNTWNGTKVAFLYNQRKKMGFLVGGLLVFS